jgi:hypothetical protein
VKQRDNHIKFILTGFCSFAAFIIIHVLFTYPYPGVADQGDFDRVMIASGLELAERYRADANFSRFFNYLVTDYKLPALGLGRVLLGAVATSISYLIGVVSLFCYMFGQNVLKTGYLAAAYSIVYLCALFIIVKYINIRNKSGLLIFSLLIAFVLLDGNYLLWFNSLYGEPMMITTLALYISSWAYYIYQKNVLCSSERALSRAVFIFISAILFLGSKMQTISALPVIVIMLIKVLRETNKVISRRKLAVLYILFAVVVIYPFQISLIFSSISKDTQYNSVFYGALKDSKTAEQDLIDMGLNPDMAVEAGKHSYLDKKEYVKYVPHTQVTEEQFYSKISNGKLVKFYITHPLRLIKGMEYTAGHAFSTGSSLGKYERNYSEEPISEFNRFTLWSELREKILPKRLLFIMAVYILVFIVSLSLYVKGKVNMELRDKIQLLWSLMVIGMLQFPMPFIGNGQADTTKQLYLFNFTFDITLVVAVFWCINKLFFSRKLLKHGNELKD